MRVLGASLALLALCNGCRAARFFGWDISSPHFNFNASGSASDDITAAAHLLANDTAGIIANLTEALKEHHKFVPAVEKNVSFTHNITVPKFNLTIPSFNFSWVLKDGGNFSHTLPQNTSGLLFEGNFTKGNFTHSAGNFTSLSGVFNKTIPANITGLFNKTLPGNFTGLFNKTIGNKTIG